MNFARFTNPPGHLERRKYNGTDYWAYVPATASTVDHSRYGTDERPIES